MSDSEIVRRLGEGRSVGRKQGAGSEACKRWLGLHTQATRSGSCFLPKTKDSKPVKSVGGSPFFGAQSSPARTDMILHRYPSDRHSRLIDCLSSTVVAVWGTAIICRNDAAMCGTASPFGTLCPSIDRTLEQLAGGNAIQSARHHRKQFIGLQPGAETWNARAWRTMHRCGVSTNHLTDFARDV